MTDSAHLRKLQKERTTTGHADAAEMRRLQKAGTQK